jgi:hypothetical protein
LTRVNHVAWCVALPFVVSTAHGHPGTVAGVSEPLQPLRLLLSAFLINGAPFFTARPGCNAGRLFFSNSSSSLIPQEVPREQNLLATVLVLLTCTATVHNAPATDDRALILRNVTIVDIERDRLVPRRDVVIMGERVVGMQAGGTARAPKQGRVLDGSGRFPIPGLWDFHVHVFNARGEEYFQLPECNTRGSSAPIEGQT